MGPDSGYFFSDLLSFIFRINVIPYIEEYKKLVYTRSEDLSVQLLSCPDLLAWGLKLFTFQ